MNVQDNKKGQQPQLCNQCNKFYGTPAHQWLCSKCFGRKNKPETNQANNKVTQEKSKPETLQQKIALAKGPQQNKSKCFNCKKKVGLLGVECKCGYVYCNLHRLPEEHQCTINYQQKGKQKLKKQIIKLGSEKVLGI